jgi:glycosyltransferase involved in cell wall biosynthesis
MRVHLYTFSLNEMRMLKFFFRHYEPWVARFVVFDDCSTDGTVDFLRSKPNVELRTREYSNPDSLVLSSKAIRDHCWKESRGVADWVIIVDIDEHLYHPDIEKYLADCKRNGVTLMPALGYQMLTNDFPAASEHLTSTRTLGAPDSEYSKLGIFDPVAIDEVDFSVGAHTATPSGRIVLPAKDELLLCHYKHLGVDYALERNNFLQKGRRALELQNNWGNQYAWKREDFERVRRELAKSLVDLRDSSHVPWRDHREPRWWREAPLPLHDSLSV